MSLPPVEIPSGAMRFNSDSQKLEYYDGAQWLQVSTFSPNLNGGARGVFGGGVTPTRVNTIEYITISSTGNSQDFGDLSVEKSNTAPCSSSTRGIFGGGVTPTPTAAPVNTIEYVTISSTGNAQDFGDLSSNKGFFGAPSNSTRGVFTGGSEVFPVTSYINVIEYITISSTGNAQDFGDLIFAKGSMGTCSSPTRGVFAGGFTFVPAGAYLNTIEYITISSTGNSQDFGDLTEARNNPAACSNPTRGVFAGGGLSPVLRSNTIDYITISSTGNAQNFGDLIANSNAVRACSSSIRGVFCGGADGPLIFNVIQYVTIASTGDAIDFGDLVEAKNGVSACSNAHGGL